MSEDRFQEFVREALDEVPAPPRDELWARIDQARRFRRGRRVVSRPWTSWALGLAAMLLVGVGLGRLTVARPAATPAAPRVAAAPGSPPPGESDAVYGHAAVEHLERAEVLLTAVSSGSIDPQLIGWAKEMLTSTQLLLDSPAARDPRMSHLLRDLELLLTQIAATGGVDKRAAELDLIHDGMEQTDVLPRLRAAATASTGRPVGT